MERNGLRPTGERNGPAPNGGTEWACAQWARILLACHADPSTYAIGETVGVTHQTVQRCLDRAMRFGVMAALDDSPRPGRGR